ncbi:hypothetical protein G033_14180 [Pectobacterium peruviense]|nr:hypothetical protein G033_14180 [Pectobacterium peruviense]
MFSPFLYIENRPYVENTLYIENLAVCKNIIAVLILAYPCLSLINAAKFAQMIFPRIGVRGQPEAV